MDVYFMFSVILGILGLSTVWAQSPSLNCIECTHIFWNQTYTFDGNMNVYNILKSKYNPICATQNPRDRNAYAQIQQQQQQQQQQGNQQNNQFNPFLPSSNIVGETICPAIGVTNWCTYVYGRVVIRLNNYDANMDLDMHIRYCVSDNADFENRCYERNTELGFDPVTGVLENRLSFLGNVKVNSFKGRQCYCNSNYCAPIINGGSNVIASLVFILMSVLLYIVL